MLLRPFVARPLFMILLLAFSVRVLCIFLLPNLHHPDETFQLMEPAHRLSFGYGISTWEFRDGLRSFVLPWLISGIFTMTSYFSDNPATYTAVLRLFLAGLSLIPIVALYAYCRTLGKAQEIVVPLVFGLWFENVYFSIRPLTEPVAASCLVCAICFGLIAHRTGRKRDMVLSGFFASAAVMVRFHIGIGVLPLAVWVCGASLKRKWLPFILGGIPPLLVFGAADWLVWGAPFQSFINSFRANVIEGKAAHYGAEPFYWYLSNIAGVWAGALPVLAALIVFRPRANLLWVLAGAAIVLSHSLIVHKEYRFIYPAALCFIVAAALGTAELVRSLTRVFPSQERRLIALAIVLWGGTSAVLAVAPGFKPNWLRSREQIQAFYYLHGQENMCGLLLQDVDWVHTGGYTYLHRNVPMYFQYGDNAAIEDVASAANYVLLPVDDAAKPPKPYRLVTCFNKAEASGLCILSRPGPCKPVKGTVPLTQQKGLGEE